MQDIESSVNGDLRSDVCNVASVVAIHVRRSVVNKTIVDVA